MQTLAILKKLSKSGGLTIPSSVRRELGIQGKEKVVVVPQENGDLLVRRVAGTCIFCGGYESVEAFKGKFICSNCRKELQEGGK